MAKKPFITLPSTGTIHEIMDAIASELEKLSPEDREEFGQAIRKGLSAPSKPLRGQPPWIN